MSILGRGTVVENVSAAFSKPNRSQETYLQLFAKRRVATLGQCKNLSCLVKVGMRK